VTTDPVSNQRLPSRIRQGLNVESGLNDGACVPLLILFVIIAEAEDGAEVEPLSVVAEEIGFGMVAGLVAGGPRCRDADYVRRAWVDRPNWSRSTPSPLRCSRTRRRARGAGGSGFIPVGGRGGRSHSDDEIRWCDLSTSARVRIPVLTMLQHSERRHRLQHVGG
jgi:hypothetical protein